MSNKSARNQGLHGSCAARGDFGVLLLGQPGSGKSDLLLRLIERGFDLVADDQVVIEDGWAAPPPELAGLIELRGLGLLRMSHVAPVRLALAVALDDKSAAAMEPLPQPEHRRLPVPSRHRVLDVPMLRVEPGPASAAFRIEIALDCLQGRRSLLAGGFS